MKILFIGGNHPRHLYFVHEIAKRYDIAAAVMEMREMMIPGPPSGTAPEDRKNFERHFRNRDAAERKYFGTPLLPECRVFEVTQETLNSEKTAGFVKSVEPEVAVIFGSGLIREPLYSALPRHTINLHLGLSPWYRGAATLFWPFYFMEPAYAGSTFHYIIAEPDAGEIIHQTTPVLEKDDGIHDVACKTVIRSAHEMVYLLELFHEQRRWNTFVQKGTGKNFLSRDFRPEHLRVIYNLFNDDMVRYYLEGRLNSPIPALCRQF
jgi:methionyl-tRNA formyltransferase